MKNHFFSQIVALTLLTLALLWSLSGCGLLEKPWWQVYFTEPGQNKDTIVPSLISYIKNSQRSIHIAAFEFNLSPVADALIAAKKQGVDVKWITDDEHGLLADKQKDRGLFAELEKAGIPIKTDHRIALMHDKYLIFDSQIVWTGSTNLTINDILKNNNNVIVIKSPELASIFERQFQERWEGKFDTSAPSTVESQKVTVRGTPIQVLFSPEDNVASHLLPVIENAKKNIRFMAFSFTDDKLGAAVASRAKAGVDVKGIFEKRGSETQYSELPMLFCAGVPVRQDGNPANLHHKVFVIDKRIVITGSYNFSSNADKNNNENVLIIENSDIAARYLDEFERLWASARQPEATKINCVTDKKVT